MKQARRQLNVRVTVDRYETWQKAADITGATISGVARDALDRWAEDVLANADNRQ